MKCTSCGNKNLFKTEFPIKSYGEGGAYISDKLGVYLCIECGHVELYAPEMVNDYRYTVSTIKDVEEEIDTLSRELETLQNETMPKITNEIKTIEEQLKSLDITIRQQKELQHQYYELQNKLRNLPNQISRTESQINQLKSTLSDLKYNFSRGGLLDANRKERKF